MSRPSGPLEGTVVVEFGNLIAAPYAGMLLADLGARVIKVEPPSGDLGRQFGPLMNGESAFLVLCQPADRGLLQVRQMLEELAQHGERLRGQRVYDHIPREVLRQHLLEHIHTSLRNAHVRAERGGDGLCLDDGFDGNGEFRVEKQPVILQHVQRYTDGLGDANAGAGFQEAALDRAATAFPVQFEISAVLKDEGLPCTRTILTVAVSLMTQICPLISPPHGRIAKTVTTVIASVYTA